MDYNTKESKKSTKGYNIETKEQFAYNLLNIPVKLKNPDVKTLRF